jgi:hypothetical protein
MEDREKMKAEIMNIGRKKEMCEEGSKRGRRKGTKNHMKRKQMTI